MRVLEPAVTPESLAYRSSRSPMGLVFAAALFFVTLVTSPTMQGGTYHNNARMECTDCHTQHNSSRDPNLPGSPSLAMRYDQPGAPAASSPAAPQLLRAGASTELCLACHSATATAPSVINSYASNHAAGAFPVSYTAMSNMAHTITTSPVSPPDNPPVTLDSLTCTTCHDPHGNGSYRNLRPDPTRTNKIPVTVDAFQTVLPGNGPIDTVYAPSNIVYKSGISEWCIKCHMAPQPGSDHPDSVAMWGSTVASYTRWATTTYPRVPVDSPTDNTIPSTDDRVTCLSCHYGHGGLNYKTLRYNAATEVQTCGECHDQ